MEGLHGCTYTNARAVYSLKHVHLRSVDVCIHFSLSEVGDEIRACGFNGQCTYNSQKCAVPVPDHPHDARGLLLSVM